MSSINVPLTALMGHQKEGDAKMIHPIVPDDNAHTVTVPNFAVATHQKQAKPTATVGMSRHVSALMTEHRSNFLRFLQIRLKDRDEAEDVLQEFCVKVILKSDQIRDEASAIGWLRIVLKSVLTDHFRRKTTERKAHLSYIQEYEITSEVVDFFGSRDSENTAEGDHSSCGCLLRLLPSLKPEYTEAIRRVDLEQANRKQAALEIGITEKNLRVRLHRARRALKVTLEKTCVHCHEIECE